MANTDFYDSRRPQIWRDTDGATELGYHTLRQANREILEAVPDYQRTQVQTKIRTTAVHRHRGKVDFSNISEYKDFIYGTEE